MTAEEVLVADGIGKSFGRVDVLKAASIRARPGMVTALIGRNGVGKTTLFRILVGRVRPDYGRVLYRGTYLPRPALHRLAREGLMYSSQESALTRLYTVQDHLFAFSRTYGRSRKATDEVVERLRLAEFLDRRPTGLSGGERQRASLALACLRKPVCLIADEPFAGAAPKDRSLIAAVIRDLADDGCAVLISGHDVDDIFSVSDRIVWATSGTTHELGTPERAAKHHQFRREYLGPRGVQID